MSCNMCRHYSYHCGVSLKLQGIMNKECPSVPTNTCHYACVSWERTCGTIRKPRGIRCNFELADMLCTECSKTCKSVNDVYMVLSRGKYMCKPCSKL